MTPALFGLALLALQNAPPPKQSYDAKQDVTTYSSGDIRTGGMTGMSAEFTFPGKTPTRPALVSMGFGALRVPDHDHPQPDADLLQWKSVTMLDLTFAELKFSLPATEGFQVSRNKTVELLFGHAIEEHVSVQLTPDEFAEVVAAPEFTVKFGTETKTIKGKSLDLLRKLAASIPAKP